MIWLIQKSFCEENPNCTENYYKICLNYIKFNEAFCFYFYNFCNNYQKD